MLSTQDRTISRRSESVTERFPVDTGRRPSGEVPTTVYGRVTLSDTNRVKGKEGEPIRSDQHLQVERNVSFTPGI